MLKRHCSKNKTMLKRHCAKKSVEFLPHDVVEMILERLPVKPLVRFKAVSKKWESTIKSQRFQRRQLIRRKQSRGPDVLYMSLGNDKVEGGIARIMLGSSVVSTVKFPTPNTMSCYGSCDGLVCLYGLGFDTTNIVVNPATRTRQRFPCSIIQDIMIRRYYRDDKDFPIPKLGFGKDILTDTYKAVWLYNSSEFGLDNVTTCEVFDFSTRLWRYVLPASSSYRILSYQRPVYFDGSLYWLTECEETKVLSFDLNTETFQIICKAPFSHVRDIPHSVVMCVLDNRLCASQLIWPTQTIWSFDSSRKNNTWTNLCSIDLTKTLSWFGETEYGLLPIAIVEKSKLLLHGRKKKQPLIMYDLLARSYDLVLKPTTPGNCVHYYQSLLFV
ncbi:unnamed protein product [Cochlearia groenlandica]